MPTSRTTPTKLATAPTPACRYKRWTSAARSKSRSCTAIFTSTSRHWRKEGDLIAGANRRAGLCHVLVHRRADVLLLGKRVLPRAAAVREMAAQRSDRAHAGGQLDVLARHAELLAQSGKEKHLDLHQ